MKTRKIPHTYVIVFTLVVFAAILTWIIPGGAYEREIINVNGINRSVVVNNSFHHIESKPQSWQILSALFDGFVDKADIIVFILIIGGAFWIMNESKAIDFGIKAFIRRLNRFEKFALLRKIGVNNIILVLIMLMFSLFGATFGMSEETIAFVIIFIPLSISMGYDSIVGVSMCFVAAALGFAGALLNPFTIGIAQGIANLPLFSGIEYRLVCWIIINLVGFAYIIRYANKILKKPQLSPMYDLDIQWREEHSNTTDVQIVEKSKASWFSYFLIATITVLVAVRFPNTDIKIGNVEYNVFVLPILSVLFVVSSCFFLLKSVHYYILNLLLFTILYLIVGVMGYHWYVKEIAALFFLMGLAAGIAMNYSPNKITKLFIDGMKDIMSAAVIVGLAGGIIIILNNGQVIDTILHYVSQSMVGLGKIGTVGIMYFIQTGINILIPSGSAKAALTMPMMSQFSDLIGLSRQATVMAFQLGDGFTNMITPTSGVLLGVLSVAKIPYERWLRWVLPFMIILVILGFLLLIPTVTMNLNGF